jgi:hypothetical protein
VGGTVHTADRVAQQAQSDLTTAYDNAASRPDTATIPAELGGTTVTGGVYNSAAGTFGITGTVTLDAQGNPRVVFIFQAASTLTTASASQVKLANGARAANVFWLVGNSATLGASSLFNGNRSTSKPTGRRRPEFLEPRATGTNGPFPMVTLISMPICPE